MKAKLKTAATTKSVSAFLSSIPDDARRRDCKAVAAMMKKVTGTAPKMWGSSIVGFGDHHYKYASGRELDWFLTGFSPRKQDLTLYLTPGVERYPQLKRKLGKHANGKSCLYINKLADVDVDVLAELIRVSVKDLKASTV